MSDTSDPGAPIDQGAQREREAILGPLAEAQEQTQEGEATAPVEAESVAVIEDAGQRERRTVDVAKVRSVVARVLWALSVLFALVLALAALLIAVDARVENGFVKFVEDAAKAVDLGIFSLDNPIKEFSGTSNAETKTALLNYGLGAVVYLILGRVLERLVRPRGV